MFLRNPFRIFDNCDHLFSPLKKHYFISLIFLLLFAGSNLKAQELEVFSKWTPYISHAAAKGLAFRHPNIYVSTPSGIYYVNYKLHNSETFSKTEGLTNLDPNAIYYDSYSDYVFLGFQDGMINMFKTPDEIISIGDISRTTHFASNKINQFLSYGEDLLIATDFGIVRYNVEAREVIDFSSRVQSLVAGLPIYSMTMIHDTLWVTMGGYGVYFKDLSLHSLPDPESWERESGANNLPEKKSYAIAATESNLYAIVDDTVFYKEDSSWAYADLPDYTYTSIETRDGIVYAYTSNRTVVIIPGDTMFTLTSWGRPASGFSIDNSFWIADQTKGLIEFGEEGSVNRSPEGPKNNSVTEIIAGSGEVYIAPKGRANTGCYYDVWGVYYHVSNTGWLPISMSSGVLAPHMNRAFHCGYYDPDTDYGYFGSCGQGVLVMHDNDTIVSYTGINSGITGWSETDIRTSSITLDQDKNMWVTTVLANADLSLNVRTVEGEWYAYQLVDAFPVRIIVDDYNNKWMLDKNADVIVFNENGTFGDVLDDKERHLSTFVGGGNLPYFKGNDIVKDLEGKIWIATDKGVSVIHDPNSVWDEDPTAVDAVCPIFEGQCLMSDMVVSCITVDSENRKWIGTSENGVYLFNPEGTELIYHFTTENSDLLSDKIIHMDIDHLTGEVYIGTDQGVTGYTENHERVQKNSKVVHAYPSPFYVNSGTPLTVRWLTEDAQAEIRDISGRIIAVLNANETGEVHWDGSTWGGAYVQSGYYIVRTLTAEGELSGYEPIIVINR